MAYTDRSERCDVCGEPKTNHPSCCGAHPFGKHAETCENRPRELAHELHRDRPDDCFECGRLVRVDFRCIKCEERFRRNALLVWHLTTGTHRAMATPGVSAEFEQHRRDCGDFSIVVPSIPA